MTTEQLQAPCGHAHNSGCRSHCYQSSCSGNVIFSKRACQEGAHCEDTFDLRSVQAQVALSQYRKDRIHASPYGILGGCVCSQCQKRREKKQEFSESSMPPFASYIPIHRGGWECLVGICGCEDLL